MNIYKQIARDLKEVNATQRQARLAFVALGLSNGGIRYLKYIEELRERKAKQDEEPTDA